MFYYELAESLGYASVSMMLSEMTSGEVSEWKAYFMHKAGQKADSGLAEATRAEARARAGGG